MKKNSSSSGCFICGSLTW